MFLSFFLSFFFFFFTDNNNKQVSKCFFILQLKVQHVRLIRRLIVDSQTLWVGEQPHTQTHDDAQTSTIAIFRKKNNQTWRDVALAGEKYDLHLTEEAKSIV